MSHLQTSVIFAFLSGLMASFLFPISTQQARGRADDEAWTVSSRPKVSFHFQQRLLVRFLGEGVFCAFAYLSENR